MLGAPTGAVEASPIAPWRWPAGPAWCFGGAAGLDDGTLFTVGLLPLFALSWWTRRRSTR